MLVSLMAAAPAYAQAVDWSRAGGHMFGDPPSRMNIEAPLARVPDLDQPFSDLISTAAQRHGLDPKLLHAVILVESAYQPRAVSTAGAAGLMQLMPATAAELGVANRFDPAENVTGGADYLARQLLRFQDLKLALAAYNSGPARVARLGRVPSIGETQDYVARVTDCYLALAAGRRARSARDCHAPGAGAAD